MTGFATPLLVFLTMAAQPQDKGEILDVRQPQVVAKALQDAGYKAQIKVEDEEDPRIISATNGSDFTIRFYGCTAAKDCGSFQFFNFYKKEPHYDTAMVNSWNAEKRFIKAAIDADGDLSFYMDVSARGGMTVENFRDTVDWFSVMDASLDRFVRERREAAAKAAEKPAQKPAG